MAPDLAARKVIVAAYCYYVLDAPVMSDGTYDELSKIAADGWDELDPVRRWCLGSPEDTRATGSHIRFTALAVSAARAEHIAYYRRPPDKPPPETWLQREDGLRYVTTAH